MAKIVVRFMNEHDSVKTVKAEDEIKVEVEYGKNKNVLFKIVNKERILQIEDENGNIFFLACTKEA